MNKETKKPRKLQLNRETLRTLTERELKTVGGASGEACYSEETITGGGGDRRMLVMVHGQCSRVAEQCG